MHVAVFVTRRNSIFCKIVSLFAVRSQCLDNIHNDYQPLHFFSKNAFSWMPFWNLVICITLCKEEINFEHTVVYNVKQFLVFIAFIVLVCLLNLRKPAQMWHCTTLFRLKLFPLAGSHHGVGIGPEILSRNPTGYCKPESGVIAQNSCNNAIKFTSKKYSAKAHTWGLIWILSNRLSGTVGLARGSNPGWLGSVRQHLKKSTCGMSSLVLVVSGRLEGNGSRAVLPLACHQCSIRYE